MIQSIDHTVLTIRDVAATVKFYTALGMEFREQPGARRALHFGRQKINLHVAGSEFEPKASLAMPGTGDLCFLIDRPVEEAAKRLAEMGVPVIVGPVKREGAEGMMWSIYCRDPDGNLVELSRPIAK